MACGKALPPVSPRRSPLKPGDVKKNNLINEKNLLCSMAVHVSNKGLFHLIRPVITEHVSFSVVELGGRRRGEHPALLLKTENTRTQKYSNIQNMLGF